MTHKEHLLSWFRRGLSITPAEAVDRWNNYRLADTVYQLRQDGHCIHTELMERTNDDGRKVVWARYSYISGPRGEQADSAGAVSAPQDPAPAERQPNGLRKVWNAIRFNRGE
jgi:hypothetical protein